ncbi:hypothetical protein T4C_8937 [Trichinella pseudospiralis]|uniref:Uncharacterized protein n=1 Tax=Trichinella pseudospiralis TaxID=6337 RepID=A0A0V1K8E3_TRIPS|nr:hypothetical protein T4C_8937 [Trichinella pseudospiralis]
MANSRGERKTEMNEDTGRRQFPFAIWNRTRHNWKERKAYSARKNGVPCSSSSSCKGLFYNQQHIYGGKMDEISCCACLLDLKALFCYASSVGLVEAAAAAPAAPPPPPPYIVPEPLHRRRRTVCEFVLLYWNTCIDVLTMLSTVKPSELCFISSSLLKKRKNKNQSTVADEQFAQLLSTNASAWVEDMSDTTVPVEPADMKPPVDHYFVSVQLTKTLAKVSPFATYSSTATTAATTYAKSVSVEKSTTWPGICETLDDDPRGWLEQLFVCPSIVLLLPVFSYNCGGVVVGKQDLACTLTPQQQRLLVSGDIVVLLVRSVQQAPTTSRRTLLDLFWGRL